MGPLALAATRPALEAAFARRPNGAAELQSLVLDGPVALAAALDRAVRATAAVLAVALVVGVVLREVRCGTATASPPDPCGSPPDR